MNKDDKFITGCIMIVLPFIAGLLYAVYKSIAEATHGNYSPLIFLGMIVYIVITLWFLSTPQRKYNGI